VEVESRFTSAPVVGVRLMRLIGMLRVMKETPAGGASKRVRVTLALPATLQLTVQTCCFMPLQEDSERATSARSAKRKEFLRFIGYPMAELILFAHVPWTHGFPELM